jgi:predicted outer membrane repeat protein
MDGLRFYRGRHRGVECTADGFRFLNCTFEECYGNQGTGGKVEGVALKSSASGGGIISNCTFYNNTQRTSSGTGLGTVAHRSDGKELKIYNSVFDSNQVKNKGGAIYVDGAGSSLHVENCTFYTNRVYAGGAGYQGGAIYVGETAVASVTNCIFRENMSDPDTADQGDNVYVDTSATLNLDYCDIDLAEIAGAGTTNIGANTINADPLFADAQNSDFHLLSQGGRWDGTKWVADEVTSLCIDAGDPGLSFGKEPSPSGGLVNMGAYGSTSEASKTYLTGTVLLIR